MNQLVVAKRYAVAIFELAKEIQALDVFEQDLLRIKQEFLANEQLTSFLNHPGIEKEKKKELLRGLFENVREEILNLLFLLVDRHRQNLVSEIVDCYIESANEERGIADAIVYTTRPLNEEEKEAIAETFAKKVNKRALRIQNVVNTDILGGVKIRIGNVIFDGSLKGKLEKIERYISIK